MRGVGEGVVILALRRIVSIVIPICFGSWTSSTAAVGRELLGRRRGYHSCSRSLRIDTNGFECSIRRSGTAIEVSHVWNSSEESSSWLCDESL